MGFITDLLRAFYDLPGLGRELSRRGTGRVAGALVLVSVVYGLATGGWYAAGVSELVGILAEEAKAHVPAFTISNGRLTSDVQQPYIFTGDALRPELFLSLEEWIKRRFHSDPGDLRAAFQQMDADKAFIFVLDTTDNYRERVNPDEFALAAVLGAERAVISSERDRGARQTREIIYANSAVDTIRFEPSELPIGSVPAQVRRVLLPWLAGISVLLTLLRFAFKALVVGLIGWVAGMLAKKSLTFGQAFAIAVFALVPISAVMLVKVLAFPLPGFVILLLHIVYGIVPVLFTDSDSLRSPAAPAS